MDTRPNITEMDYLADQLLTVYITTPVVSMTNIPEAATEDASPPEDAEGSKMDTFTNVSSRAARASKSAPSLRCDTHRYDNIPLAARVARNAVQNPVRVPQLARIVSSEPTVCYDPAIVDTASLVREGEEINVIMLGLEPRSITAVNASRSNMAIEEGELEQIELEVRDFHEGWVNRLVQVPSFMTLAGPSSAPDPRPIQREPNVEFFEAEYEEEFIQVIYDEGNGDSAPSMIVNPLLHHFHSDSESDTDSD